MPKIIAGSKSGMQINDELLMTITDALTVTCTCHAWLVAYRCVSSIIINSTGSSDVSYATTYSQNNNKKVKSHCQGLSPYEN